MTGNFERRSRPQFDNRHPYHRHAIIDQPHDRHRLTTPKVKSHLQDYDKKEHQNQNALNAPSIDRPGPSFLPLIPSLTSSPLTPPINTTSEKDSLLCFEDIEQPSTQKFESINSMKKADQETKKWLQSKPDPQLPKQKSQNLLKHHL